MELLDREGATQRTAELLNSQLEHTSTATLHQRLGDMLARVGQGPQEKSVEHYSKALDL